MNPAHFFSHQTAADLYDLPLPAYAHSNKLHVSVTAPMRAPESAGVVGHRMSGPPQRVRDLVLRDGPTAELFAFPVVEPVHLWAQLAPLLDVEDLVAIGDAIVTSLPRRGLLDVGALASIDDLWAITAARGGERGAVSMRRALPSIRKGALSRPESLIRLMALRAGFPEPALNFEVRDDAGLILAVGDLCWPEWRVVVEYDGDYHRRERWKFRSDVTRGERYADAGWFQLRAHAEDVFDDPNDFLGRLWRRMRARGWNPGRRELRQIRNARR